MAFNPCVPCTCVPGNMDDQSYYQASLITLCSILNELSTATGTDMDLVAVGGESIELGQALMAASLPVVIASDQSSLPVALATGTNSIGDIRSITTSVTPGTAAANLGKTKSVAAGVSDVGVAMYGVRNDSLALLSTTDLGYSPISISARGNVRTELYADNVGVIKAEDAATAVSGPGFATLMRAVEPGTVTTRVADGDYIQPVGWRQGSALVDINTTAMPSTAHATSILKQADAAVDTYAAGIAGVAMLGVRNTAFTSMSGTNTRYVPLGLAGNGTLFVTVDTQSYGGDACPFKNEDSNFAASAAVCMAGAVNNRGHTAFNTTAQDVTPLAVDDYGGINIGTWTVNQDAAAIEGSLAFGAVSTTYATLLTNTGRRRQITVHNTLDRVVLLSSDATNASWVIPATTGFVVLDLGANGLHLGTNLSAKSVGSSPTTGTIYATAVGT